MILAEATSFIYETETLLIALVVRDRNSFYNPLNVTVKGIASEFENTPKSRGDATVAGKTSPRIRNGAIFFERPTAIIRCQVYRQEKERTSREWETTGAEKKRKTEREIRSSVDGVAGRVRSQGKKRISGRNISKRYACPTESRPTPADVVHPPREPSLHHHTDILPVPTYPPEIT